MRTGKTEPEHRAVDLLRRADAASRGLCRNRFLHVGLAFAEAPVEHFGLDRAGRDTVDADTLLGKFQRMSIFRQSEWYPELRYLSFLEFSPFTQIRRQTPGTEILRRASENRAGLSGALAAFPCSKANSRIVVTGLRLR